MSTLRVVFAIHRIGAVELQSLPLVAALAREAGCVVDLVEYGSHRERALRQIAAFRPDIAAYSVCSNEVQDSLAFNREVKRRVRTFALFGGPHPTFSPGCIEAEGIDAICRGEGDLAFPQFLRTFGTNAAYDTPNFSFRMPDGSVRENPLTDLIPDLDVLPFPARDLVYCKSEFMARNPIKSFMAGRGCPNRCSYCFNHSYNRMYRGKGSILRTKSVGRLLAEIRDVARHYPLEFVRFHDDVFGLDPAWLVEFAERFPTEIGKPFSCYVRANMVDEDYAGLLAKAGCYSICTAIECGSERLRNEVLQRRLTDEQIRTACERLKRHGIHIFTFNMLGIPGETEGDIFETMDMNRSIGVDFADASIFQPYPGTDAFEYCKSRGYLPNDAQYFENVYSRTILNFDPAFKQRIFVLHKLFTLLVDHPGAGWVLRLFFRTTAFNGLLNLACRFYYGYFLHRRIYASVIPWRVRIQGALAVLLSKSRI